MVLDTFGNNSVLSDQGKFARYVDALHHLFVEPKSWVLHRHEIVTFEDSDSVLRESRITFDLRKCQRYCRLLFNDGQPGVGLIGDQDYVPVPIGMVSKLLPMSATAELGDGSRVDLLSFRDADTLMANVLELIGESYLAVRGSQWDPSMSASVRTIVEGDKDAAEVELQRIIDAPPGSGPAHIIKESKYFMGWARYCAENRILMTQMKKLETQRPWVIKYCANNPYERYKESLIRLWKPFRWALDPFLLPITIIDLGATWWATTYHVEAKLPKDVACEGARLIMLEQAPGGPTEKILDFFGRDDDERVLTTPRVSDPPNLYGAPQNFYPTKMIVDITLYRRGLLLGCLVATFFVLVTLLTLYLYLARDTAPNYGGNGTAGKTIDRQSLVSILILAPGLAATLAIRPGEHGLVAWTYLWVRIATIIAAFLTVAAAAVVAVDVNDGSFDKICFYLTIGAAVLTVYLFVVFVRSRKT